MNALRRNLFCRALGACLISFVACATHGVDLARPLLLVAAPILRGTYARTTLLAVPVAEAHIGFILNRPTRVSLAAAFPGHAPSAKVADPIYFGGPEMNEAIFAVVPRDPGRPSIHLFADLFLAGSGTQVDRIIEQWPNEARYFAGFVGWRPGELAYEIEQGLWYVGVPEPSLVLRKDTRGMWDELMPRLRDAPPPWRGPGVLNAVRIPGCAVREHGAAQQASSPCPPGACPGNVLVLPSLKAFREACAWGRRAVCAFDTGKTL